MGRFDKEKGLRLLEVVRNRKQHASGTAVRRASLDAERYQAYGDELARSLEADLSERTDALVRGMRRSVDRDSSQDAPDSPTDADSDSEPSRAHAG